MHYLSAMISELSYLRQANCGGDFLVRLKSARFYAFFVKTHITRVCCVILRRAEFLICVKQTADSAFLYALHPSRSLRFYFSKNHPHKCVAPTPADSPSCLVQNFLRNLLLASPVALRFSCRPPCSRVSFLIPAPKAHLKPALRIVGGEATDLAVAADESRKGVKKRRRQTLCLRSIRFRLCDSRLRQRCGAWLLRHFCHQKWQSTLRNFVAHKNKSGRCQPPTDYRHRARGSREGRQEEQEQQEKQERQERQERQDSCFPCFSCFSCPSCHSPLFTGIFFNTRAPRAHHNFLFSILNSQKAAENSDEVLDRGVFHHHTLLVVKKIECRYGF